MPDDKRTRLDDRPLKPSEDNWSKQGALQVYGYLANRAAEGDWLRRWFDWEAMRPWWKPLLFLLAFLFMGIPWLVALGLIPRAWLP